MPVWINKVDDHLAGMESSDRTRLGDLTKQLQIMFQNANSHIANADVAIITADAIRSAHARLQVAISSPVSVHQRAHDAIEYVIKSMEKQKLWFLNYKNRKDSTMSLVYNLVTQQDAANNIQLSVRMEKGQHKYECNCSAHNDISTWNFHSGKFTPSIPPWFLGASIAFLYLR